MTVGSTATTFIILPHMAQAKESGGAVAKDSGDAGMACSLEWLGATVAYWVPVWS
jgi:hypothetical protein